MSDSRGGTVKQIHTIGSRCSDIDPNYQFIDSSIQSTQGTVQNAMCSARELSMTDTSKYNEGQFLVNAAAKLQDGTALFDKSISAGNVKKCSASLLTQLSDTNSALETAFASFAEYTNANASTHAGTVKHFVSQASVLLPPLVFGLFRRLNKEEYAASPAKEEEDETTKILFFL